MLLSMFYPLCLLRFIFSIIYSTYTRFRDWLYSLLQVICCIFIISVSFLGRPSIQVICVLATSVPTLATNTKVKDNSPVCLMKTT
jgi:hypothetical protein